MERIDFFMVDWHSHIYCDKFLITGIFSGIITISHIIYDKGYIRTLIRTGKRKRKTVGCFKNFSDSPSLYIQQKGKNRNVKERKKSQIRDKVYGVVVVVA